MYNYYGSQYTTNQQTQQPNPVINIGNQQPQQPQQTLNSMLSGVNQQEVNFMHGFLQSDLGKEALEFQNKKMQEYISLINGTNLQQPKTKEVDDRISKIENSVNNLAKNMSNLIEQLGGKDD